MKKIITFILATLCGISVQATDYVVGDSAGIGYPLPIYSDGAKTYGSVSQQIILASELTSLGAQEGDITALTFYYTPKAGQSSVGAMSRSIQVYLMAMDVDSFAIDPSNYKMQFLYKSDKSGTEKIGIKVFDGTFATESLTAAGQVKSRTIDFDSNFAWDGSTNLVLTIFDMSPTDNTMGSTSSTNLRYVLASTDKPRFVHYRWYLDYKDETDDTRTTWLNNMSNKTADLYPSTNTFAKQWSGHKWVNKIKFSIEPAAAPTAPATPSDLHVESTVWNAAELEWSAVDGATSYDLQQSTDGTNWSTLESGETGTSYTWSELAEASTQYVRIRANNANGSSDWSDAVTVTTDAKHTHNSITFNKWNNPSTLPTTGNYYLGDDVVLSGNISLTGNLNLCLNGHEVYTETYCIKTSDYTLAIYDNVGGGRIYGYFVADYPNYGIINVEIGGTLVMGEGAVENLYGTDPSDSPNLSYAIYNFGTLKLSGTPTISGVDGDIYLGIGKVITIESGKPLTNTSPYSVYKSGAGAITSGWANMSGADPEDYFVSANSSLAVYDNGSEAALRTVINIRDNADNSSTIHEKAGQTLNVNLTRSWEADGYYSTLCLPFDLSSEQVSSIFGAGTELATLSSSSIDEETIYLVFESASSVEAGKPYLINPVNNVANPQIAGVTIAEGLNDVSTTYVDFKGTFSPTALAASENILCLGGSNSLSWPSAAGNLNGMRAYFEIHSLPAGAPALRHARFIAPGQHVPTAIDDAQGKEGRIEKVIEDGQVIIIRDGKKYNVLGINK